MSAPKVLSPAERARLLKYAEKVEREKEKALQARRREHARFLKLHPELVPKPKPAKPRYSMKRTLNAENFRRGENHPKAVLNEELVLKIRALAAEGVTQKSIAEQLGLKLPTIGRVVLGITWKHVGGALKKAHKTTVAKELLTALMKEGQTFVALNGGAEYRFTPSKVSHLTPHHRTTVRKAIRKLARDGQIQPLGGGWYSVQLEGVQNADHRREDEGRVREGQGGDQGPDGAGVRGHGGLRSLPVGGAEGGQAG